MTETRPQRRLAAIVAADIVGYSRLMGADEKGTLTALREVWAEHFIAEVHPNAKLDRVVAGPNADPEMSAMAGIAGGIQ